MEALLETKAMVEWGENICYSSSCKSFSRLCSLSLVLSVCLCGFSVNFLCSHISGCISACLRLCLLMFLYVCHCFHCLQHGGDMLKHSDLKWLGVSVEVLLFSLLSFQIALQLCDVHIITLFFCHSLRHKLFSLALHMDTVFIDLAVICDLSQLSAKLMNCLFRNIHIYDFCLSCDEQICVCFPLTCRHHSTDSISGGGVSGQSGQHLRHLGPTEPALPADPTHGANGPKRRHLEASGLCGLRSQQGGQWWWMIFCCRWRTGFLVLLDYTLTSSCNAMLSQVQYTVDCTLHLAKIVLYVGGKRFQLLDILTSFRWLQDHPSQKRSRGRKAAPDHDTSSAFTFPCWFIVIPLKG